MSKSIPSWKKGLWASWLSSISVLFVEEESHSHNCTLEYERLLDCTLPDSEFKSLSCRN